MKKIIFLGVLTMLMCSCEDNQEYCWSCNTETFAEDYYGSHIYQVCGMTYGDREDFEKSNTSDNGSVVITTNCKLDN